MRYLLVESYGTQRFSKGFSQGFGAKLIIATGARATPIIEISPPHKPPFENSQDFGDIFGESLGGSQAPPSFWKVPGLPRKFPELPRKFFGDFPGSSLTVELSSNQRFPGSFPDFPGSSPDFPGGSPDFPGGQPLSLGSLTHSPDSQKLSLRICVGVQPPQFSQKFSRVGGAEMTIILSDNNSRIFTAP